MSDLRLPDILRDTACAQPLGDAGGGGGGGGGEREREREREREIR